MEDRITFRTEWWLLLLLFVGAGFLHLTTLRYPAQVVFDEVHFGKFVTAYCCTGERFFDIHPPHAKLLIAGTAALFGYDGGFSFEHIGQSYGETPVVPLRLFPALTGVLLSPLFYILMRQLGGSRLASFAVAWLVLFDNALTVQTRIIALDGLLLLATFGSLVLYLAGESHPGGWRWLFFGLAGAAAGLAVGTKFTGLATLGLLGVIVFVRLIQSLRAGSRSSRVTDYRLPVTSYSSAHWISVGLVILASALVVYLIGWVFHFALLTQPGSGDAFGVPDFSGTSLLVSFFRETWELHRTMLGANYGLEATHPYASHWWTWPVMGRPVFYWQGDGALIYFLGNPIVWWGGGGLFLVALGSFVKRFAQGESLAHLPTRIKNQELRIQVWIPIAGYFIAMVPLVRIPRALFLYHYLTPLLFSLLAGVLWFDWWLSQPPRQQYRSVLYTALLAGAAVLFVVFSPITYGWPISTEAHSWLFWFSSWR